MARAVERSLYALLEVSDTASREQIEESYHRMVDYLGPNNLATYSMLEDDEAERVRASLDEAYRTLTDPELRAAYDRSSVVERAAAAERPSYPSLLVPPSENEASSTVPRPRRDPSSSYEPSAETPRSAESARPVESARIQEPAPRSAEPARMSEPAPRIVDMGPRTLIDSSEIELESDARPAPPPLPRAPVNTGGGAGKRRRLQPLANIDVGPDTEFSGSLLRRLRESAGASLNEVAEITKISKRYLTALEENDFDTLPAFVYVRGFVCEYARALGLDPKLVASSYMSLYRRYRGENG